MRFNDFDKKMRSFERSLDQKLPTGIFLAARLDGRSFTSLTKKQYDFEKPFDKRFSEIMIHTAKKLMMCGFNIIYAYTGSDEISLLFHPNDSSFGRDVRKINTILAGEASAAFSLKLGTEAVFDSRLVPLPDSAAAADYFRWRQESIVRNSLDAWCFWTLRSEGFSTTDSEKKLSGTDYDLKISLLADRNIVYDSLPSWQKYGIGLYHGIYIKEGFDPVRGIKTSAERRDIVIDDKLPHGEDYYSRVISLINSAVQPKQ